MPQPEIQADEDSYVASRTPTEEILCGIWTQLLGVKAVITKSFERIHRSNLVGMGVLPCQFKGSDSVATLGIKGDETFDITGTEAGIKPQMDVTLTSEHASMHYAGTILSRSQVALVADQSRTK